MHPAILFLAALFIPVLLVAILFLPVYLALVAALYIQYGERMLAIKYQIFTVVESYTQLLSYWWANKETLDLVGYALPTLGLPFIGFLLTVFVAFKFTLYVRNIFILTS